MVLVPKLDANEIKDRGKMPANGAYDVE